MNVTPWVSPRWHGVKSWARGGGGLNLVTWADSTWILGTRSVLNGDVWRHAESWTSHYTLLKCYFYFTHVFVFAHFCDPHTHHVDSTWPHMDTHTSLVQTWALTLQDNPAAPCLAPGSCSCQNAQITVCKTACVCCVLHGSLRTTFKCGIYMKVMHLLRLPLPLTALVLLK